MSASSCVQMSIEVWNEVARLLVILPFSVMVILWFGHNWEWFLDRWRRHRRARRIYNIRCLRNDARNGVRP